MRCCMIHYDEYKRPRDYHRGRKTVTRRGIIEFSRNFGQHVAIKAGIDREEPVLIEGPVGELPSWQAMGVRRQRRGGD